MNETLAETLNYISQNERPMELLKIVSLGLIAYLTSYFSLKKFFKEKSWERKAEAYSKIIETLHHLKRTNERFAKEAEDESNQESDKENLLRYRKASNELYKYIDIGQFYIAPQAVKALEDLDKVKEQCAVEWDNGAWIVDLYNTEGKAIEECLKAIKHIAIKEVHRT